MAAKPFHLGWFLQGSSAQAWGEPWTGHIARTWMLPDLFVPEARPDSQPDYASNKVPSPVCRSCSRGGSS